ncbi:MAG: hypothetical protein K6U04_07180 [Armatimonadetes bacterium]|nr:hypothetical protein [Armatimonadota bacterium]
MLRLKNEKTRQISLTEAFLPKELLELDGELRKVDELLNDERFLEPFLARANIKTGRPIIPVEVFLSLMYLKYATSPPDTWSLAGWEIRTD